MNKINTNTLNLIKHYESLHDGDLNKVGLQPKADPVGIYTEGYGRAMIDPLTKKWVKDKKRAYELQTIFHEEDAVTALALDLKPFALELSRALESGGVLLNDNQFGALLSMGYNCGAGPMIKTMNRVASPGATTDSIFKAFGMYNKATLNGKLTVLNGLVYRRKSEAHLYCYDTVKFYNS